jgi:hypothetical protein
MNSTPHAGRRITLTTGGLMALAGITVVLALPGTREGHADTGDRDRHHTAVAAPTAKQAALHDGMRQLWEDHITWTRLAIISFAGDLPDLGATQERLLRNQVDIGNAIKPYYGRAAGNRLTALLKEHITGAVAVLSAAKAGDQTLIERRVGDWRLNGNEIADFLHGANPSNWPQKAMRRMMRVHLDQTLSEAVHRLEGDYAADIRDYDAVHHHILVMADGLSDGIIKQFPRRFR